MIASHTLVFAFSQVRLKSDLICKYTYLVALPKVCFRSMEKKDVVVRMHPCLILLVILKGSDVLPFYVMVNFMSTIMPFVEKPHWDK